MSKLVGDVVNDSDRVNELLDALVAEISKDSAAINEIKSASPEFKDLAKSWVDGLGQHRGRPLYFSYVGSGAGNSSYVELTDGSQKLDLINGIGINILGHSHPVTLRAALKGALQDVVVQGNLQPNRELARLADKLVELASKKSRLKHCWVTTSGSMANENALKMCRQKTNGARKIIAMSAAFAGRTTMMAEVTDNDTMRVGLPRYDEILRIPFYDKNNPNSIEDTVKIFKQHLSENSGNVCAFMFELMQGEGGYNVAPREYFLPLFELCKAEGIPVWADEIQTFCRTTEFFAYETLNLGDWIDICTVAKTVQNGATLYTAELNPKPGLIAGTFAGSSAALSVGYEILQYLDNNEYMGPAGKEQQLHDKFIAMLNELNETTCKGLVEDAGGLGLMVAFTPFDGSAEKRNTFATKCFENGMIGFGCGRGPFRVRFLLPATMTDAEIQTAKVVIEKSIQELN